MASFLAERDWGAATISPLADDCSFRRYFRLTAGDGRRAIVMDAPPDKEEVQPFMRVSERLNRLGYSAPRILGQDVARGFLLLDDFGDSTYTRALAAGADEAALYRLAMEVLIDLHRHPGAQFRDLVPDYGDEKLLDEVMLFVDWYLRPGVELEISDDARAEFRAIWAELMPLARSVPEVLVLRDYHVDNMMVLEDRPGLAALGLLDFQDAVVGPVTYDIVSLLQDSRRDISEEVVSELTGLYLNRFSDSLSPADFERSYRTLGAQRALKVFGIFTRQSALYGNHQYLIHIDRLWRHTLNNLALPDLAPVRDWIDCNVPPSHRVTPRPGGGLPN